MASSGVLSELLPFLLSGGSLVVSRAGVCHAPGGERGHGCWALPRVADASHSRVLQSVPHPFSPLWLPLDLYPLSSLKTYPHSSQGCCSLTFHTPAFRLALCILQTAMHFLTHLFCCTETTMHHFLTLFEYLHYFSLDRTGFLLPLAELRCFFSVFKSLSLGSLPHIWILDSFLQSDHLCLLIYEPNLLTN